MLRRLWDAFVLWLLSDVDGSHSGDAGHDSGSHHDSGSGYDAGGGDSGVSL